MWRKELFYTVILVFTAKNLENKEKPKKGNFKWSDPTKHCKKKSPIKINIKN